MIVRIKIYTVLLIVITFLFISCKHDKEENYGKVQFNFLFNVNGTSLKTDTILYTNAAGNPYMINNIQYFITNVSLNKSDGSSFQLSKDGLFRYIDTDIPSTLNWLASDNIPAGNYTSVHTCPNKWIILT